MRKMTKGHKKPKYWEDMQAIIRMVKRKHRGTARGPKFLSLEEKEDYHKIVRILE